MTITALLLAAVSSTIAGAPAAATYPDLPEQSTPEYRGFAFAAGWCGSDQPACTASTPKDWTTPEIEVVKSAIDEILARPDGPDVLERARQRGVTVLRRYGVFIGRFGRNPTAAALRRDRVAPAIEIYDSFFGSPARRDAYSGKPGFLLVSEILLHECMHAIDDVSRGAGFLKAAGFVNSGETWRFAVNTAEEAAALARFNQEFARLEAGGDFIAQWRLGRDAAMHMRPIRVPTIQAAVRSTEAFAEIGAVLVLDPNARKYLPRDLVAYFDRNVFRRSSAP